MSGWLDAARKGFGENAHPAFAEFFKNSVMGVCFSDHSFHPPYFSSLWQQSA